MPSVGDILTGTNGKVEYGGTPTEIGVMSFKVNRSVEPVKTTTNKSVSAGGGNTYAAGKCYDWDGEFVGRFEAGITPPPFNSVVTLTFTLDTGITYEGQGFITSEGVNVQTRDGEAIDIQYTFKGTGDLTIADTTV
jgi:hypothetical protein